MLIHLQFPIVDLRGLTQSDGLHSRLPVPSWPTPLMDEEFIRSGGIVRKRWRGGLNGWVAEDRYCDARNAIAFDAKAFKQAELSKWQFKIAFRRFYFDGTVVAKFEIGLASEHIFEQSKDVFEELLRKLLGVTVRIRRPGAKSVDCQLLSYARKLVTA
jgi:hypothetical protein